MSSWNVAVGEEGSENKAKEIEWMWKRASNYRLDIAGMCVLKETFR